MQTRSSRRSGAAAGGGAQGVPDQTNALPSAAGWPLLHLPLLVQQGVVESLEKHDRRALRLTCSATARLVEQCQRTLTLGGEVIAACTWRLQQRFPAVAKLRLHCYVHAEDTAEEVLQGALRLMAEAAPAVTALSFNGATADVIDSVTSSCPNTRACTLWQTWTGASGQTYSRVAAPAAVTCICQNLLQLRTLVMDGEPLTDASMQLVAALPLASLSTPMCSWGVGAWAALGSMKQLASLELQLDNALLSGEAVDLGGLTRLTKLAIGTSEETFDDNPTKEEEAGFYKALQLPTSLISLELHHLPVLPLPPLGCLSSLHLTRGVLGEIGLGRLASSCPVLAEIKLAKVWFTQAAHAAPLQAVVKVEATDACVAFSNARFAAVFPALRDLSLSCVCEFQAGASVFGGASLLTSLDLGRSYWDDVTDSAEPGLGGLQLHDFAVLAALPALTQLRLNIEPLHVQGLALCSQLLELTLVCDVERHDMFEAVRASFITCLPPLNMTAATFEWMNDVPDDEPPWDAPMRPIVGVADAAMLYLTRAPALHKVSWSTEHGGHAHMTAARLCSAAVSTSIKHMVVETSNCYHEELHSVAQMLASNRGIDVSFYA